MRQEDGKGHIHRYTYDETMIYAWGFWYCDEWHAWTKSLKLKRGNVTREIPDIRDEDNVDDDDNARGEGYTSPR